MSQKQNKKTLNNFKKKKKNLNYFNITTFEMSQH